ncbi:neuroblastoma-amplified sequence-like, partial [Aphis craccivora]
LSILLFIIYINGLLNINVDAEIICYADDTAILVHSSSTEYLNIKANSVMKDIKDWFDNNLLELNLNKSKYIHFNINSIVNSPEINICIHSFKYQSGICDNCVILENCNYIKYLGL